MKKFEEGKWYWCSNPQEGDLFMPAQFVGGVFMVHDKAYDVEEFAELDIVEAVMPNQTMQIMHCQKKYNGMLLDAVVTAKDHESAKKLLGWKADEHTTEVWATNIGVANIGDEKIWSEESL